MTLVANSDAAAGAQFQSAVQASGLNVSALGQVAQLQLAMAAALTGGIPETVSKLTVATASSGDCIVLTGSAAAPAGTLRYLASPAGSANDLQQNVPSGGVHRFRVNGTTTLSVAASSTTIGNNAAAYALSGTTVALTADAASGATTFNANVGTGTGAVGGYVFKVPVTHGSDSVAQTLTTALTLGATTVVFATFAGKINCAVSTTAAASLNLGDAGTAPTSPANGDMWIESNTVKVRLNGATKTVTVS